MKLKTTIAVALVAIMAGPGTATVLAQSVCRSSVTYEWQSLVHDDRQEVHWSSTEKRGEDVSRIKKEVTQLVEREKQRAMQACQRERESLSNCVATKHSSFGAVAQTLGFSARKDLEKAIYTDCEQIQGRCLTASASKISCTSKDSEGEEAAEG